MTISDAFTNRFQTFCHGGNDDVAVSVGAAVAAKKHKMIIYERTYVSARLPN